MAIARHRTNLLLSIRAQRDLLLTVTVIAAATVLSSASAGQVSRIEKNPALEAVSAVPPAPTFSDKKPARTASESTPASATPGRHATTDALTPDMRAALDHVSRRYRVSADALGPIFAATQHMANARGLDPLLIVAIIGIESRFNPLAQSTQGAQGLMQIIPRYHQDKLPQSAGKLPFFDPLINVQVGTIVLQDSIRRGGGLVPGLQQFAGASTDEKESYASKVLAEKSRIEQAVRQRDI